MLKSIIRLMPRVLLVLVLLSSLTGCVWWRLYQVYNQMAEFDINFSVQVEESFTLRFHDPVVYSEDFVFLAKLQPSSKIEEGGVQRWQYNFRKVDLNNQPLSPNVDFTWSLFFNHNNHY